MNDATEPVRHREPIPRPPLSAISSGATGAGPGPEEAAFADYLYGVARRGRLIALNVFLVSAAAAITSLLLPHWYRAEGSFLPSVEERSTFNLAAFLREVAIPTAGLTDAVQAGDLSVAFLESRRVRDSLVTEFDLVRRYRAGDVEEAIAALEAHSNFFVGQEGVVHVSIEDRAPEVAARLVNRSIELLDHFNAEQRMTKGHRLRLFVERELAQSDQDLRTAEETLERYQTKTRLVPLSSEMESNVSASADLLARKMQVEIELGIKRDLLQEDHQDLRRLRSELAEIDRKLGQLPALGLEYARLLRNLKVREQVHGFLRTEYEQAKIQEQRDTPSITVVDRAEPPLKRARPRRKLIVLSAAAVAGVLSVLGALAATWVEMLPEDDRRRVTLRAARGELASLVPFRRRRDAL